MNMSECTRTVRSNLRSWDSSSSTLAPEMSETYPGTSGKTHCERNETTPARNAAMGKGSDDIWLFLRFLDLRFASIVIARTCVWGCCLFAFPSSSFQEIQRRLGADGW